MTDTQQLDIQLQMCCSGANTHTVNKARFYLRFDKGQKFVEAVEKAIATNDWQELKQMMRKWW